MKLPRLSGVAALALAVLVPGLAEAHTGGHASGFAHGIAHPVGGADHMIAMALVGLLAFQLGGRALLGLPAAFLAAMAGGALLGMAGIGLPFVEAGIALSIVVLGAAVAAGLRGRMAGLYAVVAAFAVFHGYAHGAEMPVDAGGLGYAAGFLLGTAGLHALGLGLAALSARVAAGNSPALVRATGAAAAIVGTGFLAGLA